MAHDICYNCAMDNVEILKQKIDAIERRNIRVESDKAWEVSYTRRLCIACVTYVIAALVMYFIGVTNYFASALIPVIGYILSTISLPFIKKWWTASIRKTHGNEI
jgi:hypothetical protein